MAPSCTVVRPEMLTVSWSVNASLSLHSHWLLCGSFRAGLLGKMVEYSDGIALSFHLGLFLRANVEH